MLKLIIGILLSTSVYAAAPDDTMTETDYNVAARYGFRNRIAMKIENNRKRRQINVEAIRSDVAKLLETDREKTAQELDRASAALFGKLDAVLRAEGHTDLANEIANEYVGFAGFFAKNLDAKEMGDYAPMSEWLVRVHEKVHTALGDFICQYFRFHDLFVLAYAPPVVFNPAQYSLDDMKDHFAGHMLSRWRMKHTGLAGMVTWWTVQIICSGATTGLGAATFICGPISSLSELVMNNRIAPPLAERIWERAHQD